MLTCSLAQATRNPVDGLLLHTIHGRTGITTKSGTKEQAPAPALGWGTPPFGDGLDEVGAD